MTPAHSQPPPRRDLVTFDDLVADLVWPRLLRAGALAFHPARIVLAFITLYAASAVLSILTILERSLGWNGSQESLDHLARLLEALLPAQWEASVRFFGERLVDLFFAIPLQLVRVHPLVTLVGGPMCIFILCIGAGAICRMAAVEFTAGRSAPLLQAITFARQRWAALVLSVMGPIFVLWTIGLLLATAGFFLARWPGINLIGAALYGLALAGSLLAAFLMLLYLFGKPLLIPGVCCDGADSLDAIQRAYAFVLARPLRLVSYLAILFAQGAVLLAIVVMLFGGVSAFAARATGRWAGESGRRMVYGENTPLVAPDGAPHERSTSDRLFDSGASVVRAWNAIPAAVPFAFLFSFGSCASALLYLGMRRVCDGQDMNELWSPEDDHDSALGAGALPASPDDADAE